MDIDIQNGPGSAAARIRIGPGESFMAEGGAMIAMSLGTGLVTTTKQRGGGGIMSALKRALASETIFFNEFTGAPSGSEVWLSSGMPGDMAIMELRQERIIVQGGSFVACEPGVQVGTSWQGFKSFFSGERVFWLQLSGSGRAICNSFGSIFTLQVDGEYVVDTGHIVAFQETLDFSISKAGRSWLSSYLGGEGFVCRFKGRGTVWCQSHSAPSFGHALGPLLPKR